MKCGAKACLDPLWDLDVFEINLIKTAGVTRMKCGVKALLDPL
jgi:hypothetical protein